MACSLLTPPQHQVKSSKMYSHQKTWIFSMAQVSNPFASWQNQDSFAACVIKIGFLAGEQKGRLRSWGQCWMVQTEISLRSCGWFTLSSAEEISGTFSAPCINMSIAIEVFCWHPGWGSLSGTTFGRSPHELVTIHHTDCSNRLHWWTVFVVETFCFYVRIWPFLLRSVAPIAKQRKTNCGTKYQRSHFLSFWLRAQAVTQSSTITERWLSHLSVIPH